MTVTHPRAGFLVTRPLNTGDVRRVDDLLGTRPLPNIRVRALIRRYGLPLPPDEGAVLGAWVGEHLRALALIDGALLPIGEPEAVRAIACGLGAAPVDELRGVPRVIDAALEGLRLGGRTVTLASRRTLSMVILRRGEGAGARGPQRLRRATLEDLPALIRASKAMYAEERGPALVAPRDEDLARQLRRSIAEGREFLWSEGGRLCFRASVGPETPEGAMIEDVYTAPEVRGRGHARRCLAELIERLHRRYRALVLVHDPDNEPARRLYTQAGFRRVGSEDEVLFGAPR